MAMCILQLQWKITLVKDAYGFYDKRTRLHLDNKRPSSDHWKYPKLSTKFLKNTSIVQWKHVQQQQQITPASNYLHPYWLGEDHY